MTDGHQTIEEQKEEREFARENRKRIVRFVVVFVCIALALLISYRYARHTRVNDRYLYEAARDTAWVLDRIGDAELEPYTYGKKNPQEIRAERVAWLEGRNEATAEEIAGADKAPLSSWERWAHRAMEARRSATQRENGPRVQFVFRHGISSRISVLSGRVNEIESNLEIGAMERKEQLKPLQEELQQLREEQRIQRSQEGGQAKDETLAFSFILVPECGAIEIMAIFLAAVIAFPTTWRRRLIGVVAGTPIMYGVNIFRLTVLAIVGALDQSKGRIWFNFAHEYVWQAVYIVFVVAVWLVWVEYVVKGKRT